MRLALRCTNFDLHYVVPDGYLDPACTTNLTEDIHVLRPSGYPEYRPDVPKPIADVRTQLNKEAGSGKPGELFYRKIRLILEFRDSGNRRWRRDENGVLTPM